MTMTVPPDCTPKNLLEILSIRRPNSGADIAAWEQSWERDFKLFYDSELMARDITHHFPQDVLELFTIKTRLNQYEGLSRALCRFQMKVFPKIAHAFAGFELEKTWKDLPHTKRKELILEGLGRTIPIDNMNSRRAFCPDSTCAQLTSRSGEAYLSMLKNFLPEDVDAPLVEPFLFPGLSQVDYIIARLRLARTIDPRYEVLACMIEIDRAWCWSHILWNVLAAHQGLPREIIHVQRRKLAAEAYPEKWAPLVDIVKPIQAKMLQEIKHNGAQFGRRCSICQQSHGQQTKLFHCKVCKAVDREVLYCSPKCQIQDWKHGLPTPHKTICGKPVTLATSPTATPVADTTVFWLPEAAPSFKRSPALLFQLSLLREGDGTDYVVIDTDARTTVGIHFVSRSAKLGFLVHRNRAFRTGQLEDVRMLLIMINGYLRMNEWAQHVSMRTVRRQLEREYGVTLPVEYDSFRPLPQHLSIRGEEEEIKIAVRTIEMDKHLED